VELDTEELRFGLISEGCLDGDRRHAGQTAKNRITSKKHWKEGDMKGKDFRLNEQSG
jgi:hypothetical protein